MTLPAFIFDTSPLITLAGALHDGQHLIEHILPFIQLLIVETVAQEATANLKYPDAQVVQTLLNARRIGQIPVPNTPVDSFIDRYPKLGSEKGKGERDTIRLGIATPGSRVVIDDQQAFFVAARFDLRPITLLDLIVELTRSHKLDKPTALNLVNAIAGRYAAVSIEHTFYKLNEVKNDSDHH